MLCVLGKSGALISNVMAVFMLSKVYISCLSQKHKYLLQLVNQNIESYNNHF